MNFSDSEKFTYVCRIFLNEEGRKRIFNQSIDRSKAFVKYFWYANSFYANFTQLNYFQI